MSKVRIVGFSLAALLVLWIAYGQIRRAVRFNLVTTQGKAVVDAIERYRNSAGQYPETLEQLIPEFLLNLPVPSWGTRRWSYRSGGREFVLYVLWREDTYQAIRYSSQTGEWEWDT